MRREVPVARVWLPYFDPECMVLRMKTTLVLDDGLMRRVKAEAARQGRTLSDLVEAALRASLDRVEAAGELPPLPSFRGGRPLVDIACRGVLHDAMEGLTPSSPAPRADGLIPPPLP